MFCLRSNFSVILFDCEKKKSRNVVFFHCSSPPTLCTGIRDAGYGVTVGDGERPTKHKECRQYISPFISLWKSYGLDICGHSSL